MAGSNTVDKARSLIEERLAEIDDERKRLEGALKGLGGSRGSSRRGPGRPRGSSSKKRRRRQGGTRADHAMQLIRDTPGVTPSEIATQLGIKPNYLYRVMAELQKDGMVRKEGRGYYPAGGGASAPEPAAETSVEQTSGQPLPQPLEG